MRPLNSLTKMSWLVFGYKYLNSKWKSTGYKFTIK